MPIKKDKNVLTVSQLNDYVKMMLDNSPILSSVYISGEISNLKLHSASGHLYFTLKDQLSSIKAVMFRSSVEKMRFVPENGMQVIVNGRVSAYVRDGVYQIYASSITPEGIGDIALSFEQLKEKLKAEGLFDEKYKKPIPNFPKRIGIITSPTGAAIKDIINVTSRRYSVCELILYPALVQGSTAEQTLVNGINYFSQNGDVDVIIIGRGGGSGEDLQAFNSEKLARAVFACTIPVISAVGHEQDYSICDFVADLRAPTPSAAAELAVPDKEELKAVLSAKKASITKAINDKISSEREYTERLRSSAVFSAEFPLIAEKREELKKYKNELSSSFDALIQKKRTTLSSCTVRLDGQSPLAILSRGYASISKDGVTVKSVRQIDVEDEIKLVFSDGNAKARIIDRKE